MSTYLVDFENVGVGGMDGVEKLSDHDRVVIFYGKQAAAVPFERHIEIASSRAEVRYIKVDKTGKNFLDFQLSSYCGYLIGSTAEKDFIIVSRDNGFGSMEDFWDGKEMSGKLISMKRQPAIAVNEEKAESVFLREEIDAMLKGLSPREREVIVLRFGLESGRPMTLEEVGKRFNVTRERIRQIETAALRKLRNPTRSKKIKDFLP